MKKGISNYNEKGQPHGLWEIYHGNGNLSYKGNYINGRMTGYWILYWTNGDLKFRGYYIDDKLVGN